MENEGIKMKKAAIFSGMEKGRILCEKMSRKNVLVTLFVTQESDEKIAGISQEVIIVQKALSSDGIEQMLKDFDVVLDATELQEFEKREIIRSASKKLGIPYLCVQAGGVPGIQMKRCSSPREAVAYLNEQDGNILLTNIKNELSLFTEVIGFQERCKVKALPTMDSILACNVAGFSGEQILATAGIYSVAFLKQLLVEMNARYVVTVEAEKDSEATNMMEAVKSLGITFVIIQNTASQKGSSIDDTIQLALQFLGETE